MGTTVGVGAKSSVTFAKETTFNTAPTTGTPKKLELITAAITPRMSVIEDPSMSNAQASRRFVGQGGQYYEWSMKLRINYEGMEELWRMYLPTYTNAVTDTTARDHTFKEGVITPGAVGNSYCIDFSFGDVPSGTVNRLTAAYGTDLRITGQAGTGENAMLMVECKGLAKTLTSGVTPATGMTGGSFPAAYGVIFHQAILTTNALKDGSANTTADIRLKSFDLSYTRPFDPNRFYFGSVSADYPVPSGPVDATWTFEEEWNDKTLLDNAKANTPTGLLLTMQHPTVVGSTTAKREFELLANSITASDYSGEIPGFGVIIQRVSYRLWLNTGDSSLLVLRTRNAQGALT